ncbi:MAG: DUF2807 domain-containing protein [Segetibacter sp.]
MQESQAAAICILKEKQGMLIFIVTGSGNYDSPNLKAENANVKILGSGDASLFAEVNLEASIAGSGDIKYRGNAAVKKDVAGSGSFAVKVQE